MKYTVWDGNTSMQRFFYPVPVEKLRQMLDKIQMFIEDFESDKPYYKTEYSIEVDRCVIDASNHRTIGTISQS